MIGTAEEIGSRLSRLRESKGYSVPDLVERIRVIHPTDPVNATVIRRIENGATQRPHKATLMKLAEGLDVEVFDILGRSKSAKSTDVLSAACVHSVFSLPALMATSTGWPLKLDFVSLMAMDEDGRPEPRWSEVRGDESQHSVNIPDVRGLLLDSAADDWNGSGHAPFTRPLLAARSGPDSLAYSPSGGDNTWASFCTGPQMEDLWRNRGIDAAIASRDIFDEFGHQGGAQRGVRVGGLSRSARGLSLVTLIHPAAARVASVINDAWDIEDGKEPLGGAKGEEREAEEIKRFDKLHTGWRKHYREFWKCAQYIENYVSRKGLEDISIEKIDEIKLDIDKYNSHRNRFKNIVHYEKKATLNGGALKTISKRVIVPKDTFAVEHIKHLSDSIMESDIGVANVDLDATLDLGDYQKFRDRLFEAVCGSERVRPGGIVTVALWEPYATFIRNDWDLYVAQEGLANSEDHLFSRWADLAHSSGRDSDAIAAPMGDELGTSFEPKDFIYSWERGVGNVLSAFALEHFPPVTMDVYVREDALRKVQQGVGKSQLMRFFRVLAENAGRLERLKESGGMQHPDLKEAAALLFGDLEYWREVDQSAPGARPNTNWSQTRLARRTLKSLKKVDYEFNYSPEFFDRFVG